ncbi:MAG TPA: glycosyltransferase family 4 protein [Terriglobales bacterium]|nr:glycosyltransferase family 4 protein [Terriglobales bacterium]
MRFAFISTLYDQPWGASEELWSQAATQLKREGHDVQASTAYWPQLPDKLAALGRHGIKLEAYPSVSAIEGRARHFWNRLSLGVRRSHDRLKRFNPDLVIISQGANSGGFAWAEVCRNAAIPYLMIVHCNSESWWIADRDVNEAVASYTRARKVFCVSRNNLDMLRLQLGESLPNGEVVWNPVKISTEPAPPWPSEDTVWRLACVGRMHVAQKGQDLLLQILARPEWRDRPVELNLFGSGPDELGLRRLSTMLQLNNVHFRGHVNDVRAIWEQNHLLLQPSRYEGVPLTLVEAMWYGRPAVVTDVGRSAELCVDNETGCIAPAATVSSFGNALERAWDRRQDWLHIGQAARARAEKEIPKDPVGEFCERLKVCAAASSAAMAAG